MNFTFGIITGNYVEHQILDSIVNQNISEYEIIIVGGEDNYDGYDVNHIPFDENSGKYTVKKNIITKNAKFDNIVYMHDYYILDENWYKGFLEFGNTWELCMNIIENKDGTRFRDWCAYDDPELNFPGGAQSTQTKPVITDPNHRLRLPSYDYA